MHSLSIAVGNQCWRLLFKTEESATLAFTFLKNGSVEPVLDDYGQSFFGLPQGLLLEDMDKSKLAYIETALHNARANVDANKRAQTDPALRASRLSAGPPMLNQMGNGQFQ